MRRREAQGAAGMRWEAQGGAGTGSAATRREAHGGAGKHRKVGKM